MKKVLNIFIICVIAVFTMVMLTSCKNQLRGTYTKQGNAIVATAKVSYTFKGNKYTQTNTSNVLGSQTVTEINGKYEITEAADGTKTISFTYRENDTEKTDSFSFSETVDENGNDAIEIGGVLFIKQK